MNRSFSEDAWDEYTYWQRENKKILKKINQLIDDIERHPYCGIGKPEMLRHDLSGYCSRRITDEHRLVYKVEHNTIFIIACRYHYQ